MEYKVTYAKDTGYDEKTVEAENFDISLAGNNLVIVFRDGLSGHLHAFSHVKSVEKIKQDIVN